MTVDLLFRNQLQQGLWARRTERQGRTVCTIHGVVSGHSYRGIEV